MGHIITDFTSRLIAQETARIEAELAAADAADKADQLERLAQYRARRRKEMRGE